MDIVIAPDTQRRLRRVVRSVPEEVFGNMAMTPQGLTATSWYRGGTESTGDIHPTYPDTYYTYHTHPAAVYSAKKFTVGWPSVQDVEMVLFMLSRRPPEQILHVVFTVEGMYIMDFPPENRQKALRIYEELVKCKEFPCCKNGGQKKESTAEFCEVFDQDTRRGKDRISDYISAAISHGTVRIQFQRWEPVARS